MILSTEEIIDLASVVAADNPIAVFIEPGNLLSAELVKNWDVRLRMITDRKNLVGEFNCDSDPEQMRRTIEYRQNGIDIAPDSSAHSGRFQ